MVRYIWILIGMAAATITLRNDAYAVTQRAVDIYVTKPTSGRMILPDTKPSDFPGKRSNTIALTATPGEYEPASFVVRSKRSIHKLMVVPSDLKNGSRTIPASDIDIKIVKCWYQSKGAWKTMTRLGFSKTLVPELLLNDDTLIKVDTKGKENYIKLKYADGSSKYVCISKRPNVELEDLVAQNSAIYETAPGINNDTPIEQFPVKDSPKLLPLDIKSEKNQQFWLTVRVPENAQPGTYRGIVKLVSSGRLIESIKLEVRVLPFRLSDPRTHHDPNREFVSSIYYRGSLDPKGKGSTTTDTKNPRQFLAEMKNLRVHGVTQPFLCIPYGSIAGNDDYFRQILSLRKEAGISGPFYMLFDLAINQQDAPALAELKEKVRHYIGIVGEFGIQDFYFYGIDEASGDLLKSERAAWNAVHEAGGKVIVSGYAGMFEAMGDILDTIIWNGSVATQEAKKWHSVGHSIWSYANPFGGVENPSRYRRSYGFELWKADYDGAATYCYQTGAGGWNDFNDCMRDHSLTYPTMDGAVDTIAWEGYREGMDDIKYGSTLKLEIEKAKLSSNKNKQKAAAKAEEFLNKLDPKEDCDITRQKVIEHILALRSAR